MVSWASFWRRDASSLRQQTKRAAFAGGGMQVYMVQPGQPVWMNRDYLQFADEGYLRNVVVNRCVNLVAGGAASVEWKLEQHGRGSAKKRIERHPLLDLLKNPSPYQGGAELFEQLIGHRLLSGNAFLQVIAPTGGAPRELYALRPDKVQVIAGQKGLPAGYRYTCGEEARDYPINAAGFCPILHWKQFHPLSSWYGASPVEAAAYSIDQHNQQSAWNQALLQNGARPSGALVVRQAESNPGGNLSDEQYQRLKQQIEEQFSGAGNAGRPLLLEGGLEWKEMAHSPRDMDFTGTKNAAARDIALAFGVPPQLLGIPGDNTYSNYAEARLALWEETILPLLDSLCDALNFWLVPLFGGNLTLSCDTDRVSALTLRRERLWQRLEAAGFLDENEKRAMVGFGPRQPE